MYPGERHICSAHLTVASAQHIRDLHVDGTGLRFQGIGARTKAQFNGVGRLRTYISFTRSAF
jgi:hypothetical protein